MSIQRLKKTYRIMFKKNSTGAVWDFNEGMFGTTYTDCSPSEIFILTGKPIAIFHNRF